jgi:hypothetical protein
MRHLPVPVPEGLNELQKTAVRFEATVLLLVTYFFILLIFNYFIVSYYIIILNILLGHCMFAKAVALLFVNFVVLFILISIEDLC